MTTANTYQSLNDYRISTTSTYENGPGSKLGAGAIVIAIFLGVGSYFYFSTPHHSTAIKPASDEMNYQATAAPDSAAPAGTVDEPPMSDAPNAAGTSPAIPSADANAARATAANSAMSRAATQSPSNVAPAQPAQATPRTKQPFAKPATQSTSRTVPTSTDNTATTTPDMSSAVPVIAPPIVADPATNTAPDPMTSNADMPSEVAAATVSGDGTGG